MSPGAASESRNPQPLANLLTVPTDWPGARPPREGPRGVLERSRIIAGGTGCCHRGIAATEASGAPPPPVRCTLVASARPFPSVPITHCTGSPATRGCCPFRWAFPLMPTKRSPWKAGDTMNPWALANTRTDPCTVWPTSSKGSLCTIVTLVACRLPSLPMDIVKDTEVPTATPCACGLSRRWKKQSPSKASEVKNPQSNLKDFTTPYTVSSTRVSTTGMPTKGAALYGLLPLFGAAGKAAAPPVTTTSIALGFPPVASTRKLTCSPPCGGTVSVGLSRM
mmetsp:Transcript_131189/g.298670  ORF Transcript_131189/g.298670 Transcript_131189/m.298670 type:complete len:280 (+) Transcript_131189:752-1591(+)